MRNSKIAARWRSLRFHRHAFGRCQRTLLTEAVEPPPCATERPCTIILAQDSNLGVLSPTQTVSSWSESFTQKFPVDNGMPVTQWSPSPDTPSTFEDALDELKTDLACSSITQPILVARGPWISWMAQFYLESLPLSALIMVDPLPFGDDTAACRMYENLHQYEGELSKNSDDDVLSMSLEYQLFQDYVQHANHWTLQLEPAVIPTMVLSTIPLWHDQAVATAARHSDDASAVVPVVSIRNDQNVVSVIGDWILEEDIL